MKTLSFQAGNHRYAIAARDVIEIVPWVALRDIPRAPAHVAGLLNYRGAMVPVIDLTCLMTGVFSKRILSTRILLVSYPGKDEKTHILGALVEQIATTDGQPEKDFAPPGIRVTEAPYLGGIAVDKNGTIQLVRIEALLPEALRNALFTGKETSGS